MSDLLSLMHGEADYRNGTCGWCERALASGFLPDGRKHYFCAAFPSCRSDSAKDRAKREVQRSRALESFASLSVGETT